MGLCFFYMLWIFNVILSKILDSNIFDCSIRFVKLSLFNHVLVLFHAKFACNSAIRYPVFRLELCKSYVWKSVKKLKCVCIRGFSRLDLANDSRLATCQMPHVWSMQEAERSRQLEHYKTKSTIWPNNYLAT